jgi:hypothetical protein
MIEELPVVARYQPVVADTIFKHSANALKVIG